MMNITSADGHDWRQWVLVTSIPLVRLDECDTLVGFGSGTMIDHAGSRFIVAAEHVVKRDSTGWAVVVQQDGTGQLEYYRPNAFTYVGEVRKSAAAIRFLDLCTAEVSSDLQTWYEYRTPRGLFEKRLHHVFDSGAIASPEHGQVYGFSGQVRTERHGNTAFASDMAVYSGLTYSHSEEEIHHFMLPVPHPGHDAFQGCSGAPIVDFNRKVVALVVEGDTTTNTIKGVAIQRILPSLQFLACCGK